MIRNYNDHLVENLQKRKLESTSVDVDMSTNPIKKYHKGAESCTVFWKLLTWPLKYFLENLENTGDSKLITGFICKAYCGLY